MIEINNTMYYNTDNEEIMPESFELLNTTELSYEIENMFRKENHFILILSPFLDLTEKIQSILSLSKAKVVIIYRENEQESKRKAIDEFKIAMPNVNFYCVPNFHAKAYITSGTMIITSLNLYEHSQINNFELGIILKEISYNKMIGKLYEELKILFHTNKIDLTILENLDLPDIVSLFDAVLEKNKITGKKFSDLKLSKQFCEQLINRYTFEKKDFWKEDKNMLQRPTKVNSDMFEWALENINLNVDL